MTAANTGPEKHCGHETDDTCKKLMVENGDPETWPFTSENISAWIDSEYDGYCEVNATPEVEY